MHPAKVVSSGVVALLGMVMLVGGLGGAPTAGAAETTTKAPETTTTAPETTVKAPETTVKAPETTTTVKAPETTTKAPETTTKAPETTTKAPAAPVLTTTGSGSDGRGVSGSGVIPLGHPETGAGGASHARNNALIGLGGLALVGAGAAMVADIRRRRRV